MTEEQASAPETSTSTDGQSIESALPAASTEKPAGYAPVDLSVLPDDVRKPVEERLNYMYKQIKTGQKTLNEFRGIARTQSEKIEELMSGMGQVVDHLHTKGIAEEESNAKQLLKLAHESGDTDAFVTAQERLAEIKAKKEALKNQPKPPKQQKQQIQEDDNADVDPEMAYTVKAWQSESDERGQPLRPWAQSKNPQDPLSDPVYRRAYLESAVVFDEDGPFSHLSVQQKLAEVDRRMGVTKTGGGQNVMGGGNLTVARNTSKITLTPRQQEVALRLKVGGSKAKSDSEHLEAYRKQLEKINARKGAR